MNLSNITCNIRVDEDTNKGSVIDVIRMVNPSLSSAHAGRDLQVVISNDPDMNRKVDHVRINGKGRETPVADARTLVEIVWLLPGKAAREFRRTSAAAVCRVLRGDLSLVREIEERHYALQSTEEGRAAAQFLTDGGSSSSGSDAAVAPQSTALAVGLPAELSLVDAEGKRAYFQLWMERQRSAARREEEEHRAKMDDRRVDLIRQADALREGRARTLHSVHKLMLELGGLDDRDRIEFKDRTRMILSTQFEPSPVGVTPAPSPALPALEAAAAEVDDRTLPTPLCSAAVRGPETSLHVVCTKLNLAAGERAGQIGKVMKRKYTERYGERAASEIPKRATMFRGKPFAENTYYERDQDLLEAAVREVLQPGDE